MNAVENWAEIKPDDFHRLAHIRNQFAHTGKQVINIDFDTGTDDFKSKSCLILESVSGSGKLLEVESDDALHEFTQLFA